jgi:hypothetical protein
MSENIVQKIKDRVSSISINIQKLTAERQALTKRLEEVEVRMHQLVGALYELQNLTKIETRQSEQNSESADED